MNDITKEYHLIKSQIHYKENNSVKVRKVTKVHLVKAELEKLEVGGNLVKDHLVRNYWGYSYTGNELYLMIRSFDVAFLHAKKLLPEMRFRTAKGLITRIA